jgi:hypothetical protein
MMARVEFENDPTTGGMVGSPARKGAALRRWRATRAVLLLAMLTGLLNAACAQWSYDRVKLGQGPPDYERAFPAESARRTHLGLCSLREDVFGRTDAVVVLLTHDRRVAGKVHATRFIRDYGFKTDEGFLLQGELDPQLAELQATAPLDTLRAIAVDLAEYQGERLAMEAHAWVAGGLVRLIQCWPHVNDIGIAAVRLTELFELVPGGGEARIAVNPAGIYQFEYRKGKTY